MRAWDALPVGWLADGGDLETFPRALPGEGEVRGAPSFLVQVAEEAGLHVRVVPAASGDPGEDRVFTDTWVSQLLGALDRSERGQTAAAAAVLRGSTDPEWRAAVEAALALGSAAEAAALAYALLEAP